MKRLLLNALSLAAMVAIAVMFWYAAMGGVLP